MAPEMVKNQPYDHRLDIWCLGVLLYELLHGDAPFKGKTDQEKCDNIAHSATFQFSYDVSYEARDLIQKILRPRPADRISMDEILRHPWMQKFERVFETNIQELIRQQDALVMQAQQENGSRTDLSMCDKPTATSLDSIKDEDSQIHQSIANKKRKKTAKDSHSESFKYLEADEDQYHKKEIPEYLKKQCKLVYLLVFNIG